MVSIKQVILKQKRLNVWPGLDGSSDSFGCCDSARINDKIARQVLAGVLDGEGAPTAIVEARGLEVVSDDSALEAAVRLAPTLKGWFSTESTKKLCGMHPEFFVDT